MSKKWQIFEEMGEKSKNLFPELQPLILQILYNRGVREKEKIANFLNPAYRENTHNPFLFKDMEVAVERIILAFRNKENITIFGDYDADGVTSTALLAKILQALFLRCGGEERASAISIYIPHRGREGYGLNKKALEFLKNSGTKLIITVDCGISNLEELIFAKELGLDVIITDHHHPPQRLPEACAVINPKVMADEYPFRELAGVGVAFKLAQALLTRMGEAYGIEPDGLESLEKWLLDLVAIGTVADCCPIIDENRIFVKYGLLVLNKTRNIGLKYLMEKIGIAKKPNCSVRCHQGPNNYYLDTWAIGFQLAPRINSAGRLGHANTSYQLLTTQNDKEAEDIAHVLDDTNAKRQTLTESAFREAMEIIEKEQKNNFTLFVKGNWEPGIIGLIAGKISEYYHRPTFVFTKIDGELVASGRSIPEFNLIEAVEKNSKYLKRYGGHSQACGFSMTKEEEYILFTREFLAYAEKILQGQDLIPVLSIDAVIKLKDINWELWESIKSLEPYGEGNPKPLFMFQGLLISEIRIVGNGGKHLKLKLQDELDFKFMSAIGFSLNNEESLWSEKLKAGNKIDVVGYIDVNEWNGNRELQLKVVDLRINADA